MAPIKMFDAAVLERVCDVLGVTAEGLTGGEIGRLLDQCQIEDPSPTHTKRIRLGQALLSRQKRDNCGNNIVAFIQSAMAPVRYTGKVAIFEARRKRLNEVLAFASYQLGADGVLVAASPAATLGESQAAAGDKTTPFASQIAALRPQYAEVLALPPKPRGFAFERFLNDLFLTYDLAPRGSFRLVGEQIDGSFQLLADTYLVEAKWENKWATHEDLLVFAGKVSGRAQWSRGLFISHTGFSPDGLDAFMRGKPTCIICMDGLDLHHVLEGTLDLRDVIVRKARRAVETNRAFVPVRELFPGVL